MCSTVGVCGKRGGGGTGREAEEYIPHTPPHSTEREHHATEGGGRETGRRKDKRKVGVMQLIHLLCVCV